MTRIAVLACVVFALVAVPARAADQATHAKSPKVDFTVSHNLIVGTTTLKPGAYMFQCVMVGDRDFLVITNEDGKEVARVPCKAEDVSTVNAVSDYRFSSRPDGTWELTGVRVRGEKIEHRVVSNG